ncbi:MAG: tRNA (adenosine(37)-N6)-threonylcarbamoyltransferase complex dimerization subunit type 1 TsaB, partial [Syntrophaceae bacterium]|nr:tRNA (adenosine(37)-N6)-threonylcarbamoyltransferase complex dimerization subunit type 1 TsaB [Syntrophaceae bacterium]
MLTLAFDTSFKTVAVAIMQDDVILYDALINSGLNHSETLLPSIDQALRQLKLKIEDIDLFACTLGPGSFTGLRVGVSTLKGLLLATGKPSAGVSSLASLALNVTGTDDLICPVMDAGRGQVYTASYRYNDNGLLNQISPEIVVDPQDILPDEDQNIIFVGEGAIKYRDLLTQKAKAAKIASISHQHIRACTVGILG